ncbi:MAG: hypothetical protein GY866_00820 [Proteobacteria bacterium]|nr:hypothetical protein [Pseudomonadota bacterium]
MFLNHVAQVCSSEEKSDRFYCELLGLDKMQPKVLSSDLSNKIFDLDKEYTIINYAGEHLKFEIFISRRKDFVDRPLGHVCLEIEDLNAFLERCAAMEIDILRIPKGEALLTFIKDYDGNMFEIKQKQ